MNDKVLAEAIRTMRLVRVVAKDGRLTDISIVMLLNELKRHGISLIKETADARHVEP